MNLIDLKSTATGKYELIDALLVRAGEPMGGNHKWQNLTIRDASGDYEVSAYYDQAMSDMRVEQDQVGKMWQFRVRAVKRLNFINLQGHINGPARKDKNMPNVNDLKDSKFLTKEDCGPRGLQVTITGWAEEDVSMETQPTKMKYVLHFKELAKPLVLNNTNGQRIALLTGKDDFDDWTGHQITLFNDPTVEFGGKLVGGIRVSVPQQAPVMPATTNPGHRGDGPPPATDADVPDDVDDY